MEPNSILSHTGIWHCSTVAHKFCHSQTNVWYVVGALRPTDWTVAECVQLSRKKKVISPGLFFSINVWEEKFSIMRVLGFPRRAAEEQADYWQEWMGGIMGNWAQFSHSITCLCIDERCSLCNRKERKKEMWQKWKQGEKNNNTNAVKSHWLNTAWEKRVIWKVKNRLSVSISKSNEKHTILTARGD